jgi:hypothetical protein
MNYPPGTPCIYCRHPINPGLYLEYWLTCPTSKVKHAEFLLRKVQNKGVLLCARICAWNCFDRLDSLFDVQRRRRSFSETTIMFLTIVFSKIHLRRYVFLINVGLDNMEHTKKLFPCRESNPGSYTDWAIPAPTLKCAHIMLQTWRSRFRISMRSLDFSVYLNLPAAL